MPRTAKHLEATRWKPGVSGNPAGKPIGSRTKLQELTLRFLHKDFAEHGEETIRRVREKRPDVYLAAVVSLLPKQAQKLESPFIDLTDDELEHLEQLLAALRAKTVQDLAAHARGTEPRFNERPRINGKFAPRQGHSTNHTETVIEQPAALNGHGNAADQESQEASVTRENAVLGHAAPQQEPSSSDTDSSS